MKSTQQIEDWIDTIESSNISPKKQEQHISDVVDFWKFVTTFDKHVSILEKGKILTNQNGCDEITNITTFNLIIKERINPFEAIISEVEQELMQFGTKYLGLYSIRFHNLSRNFQEEDLAWVKEEILSAIKGEIVFYKYIYKLNKIESTELKIFKNDLGVLQCNFDTIEKQVSKIKSEKTEENQWLVLLLDGIDHNCNSFLFQNKINEASLKSNFDKVFLFDFYKAEIIELKSKVSDKSRLKLQKTGVNYILQDKIISPFF